MFFLHQKYRLFALVATLVEKVFPQRVSPTLEGDGWLITYQPICPFQWEPEEEGFPEECECHPGYVCHACRAYYKHRRELAPIPF